MVLLEVALCSCRPFPGGLLGETGWLAPCRVWRESTRPISPSPMLSAIEVAGWRASLMPTDRSYMWTRGARHRPASSIATTRLAHRHAMVGTGERQTRQQEDGLGCGGGCALVHRSGAREVEARGEVSALRLGRSNWPQRDDTIANERTYLQCSEVGEARYRHPLTMWAATPPSSSSTPRPGPSGTRAKPPARVTPVATMSFSW